MINLLPQSEIQELSKGAKKRVLVTSLWAIFFASLVSSVLLVPSYVIINSKLTEVKNNQEINSRAKNARAVLNTPQIVNEKAALTLRYSNQISIADRVALVSSLLHKGIVVNKISYEVTKKDDVEAYKIVVLGRAETRDSLTSFKREAEALNFVKDSQVPVGDFAKDKDLSFTLTLNLK